MTNATGFLVRTDLGDTGKLPRSGSWTGCPDIIPAGTTALDRNMLISSYDKRTDRTLAQGQTNYLYVRAKNMNTTPLAQVAYLFAVPGSLILHPEVWYGVSTLVGYDAKTDGGKGGPDEPTIIKKYAQPLSAEPGAIAATNAYTWKPLTTEHHCLVAVVADSWDAVLKNYDGSQGGSVDALAKWIYGNPSMGWHNVNIAPYSSMISEGRVSYATNAKAGDSTVTFTIIARNVPVGAKVSFSSGDSTAGGRVIGQDWTTVPEPVEGGKINHDFEIGTTLTVNPGFRTIITYRTDFNGTTPPPDFKMSMKATTSVNSAELQGAAALVAERDSLELSFARSHSPNAIFVDPDGRRLGRGLDGYAAMRSAARFDSDDDGDLDEEVVVVVGSHTTILQSS